MISKSDLQKSIKEIYALYQKRNIADHFTLETIHSIFEIGNEVFLKHSGEELDKLQNRKPSKAPDLLDDEPFSFKRTFEIFNTLQDRYSEVTPDVIQRIFELNSKIAWDEYRVKYDKYIVDLYADHPDNEYINYLAAVVLYEKREFDKALKCINIASSHNSSSAKYTHIKGLCMMQLGEMDVARTYLYQGLFLIELMQDNHPRRRPHGDIYPNFPVEFQTTVEIIRADLKKLDQTENVFQYGFLPLFT